jgi:hypothetical protein
MPDSTGAALIVKVLEAETTPLVVSVTATLVEPAAANKVEGKVTVIKPAVFEVGVNGVTLKLTLVQLTTVPDVGKLLPVRVNMVEPCPATATVGLILERVAAGLTVKALGADETPLVGSFTTIAAGPAVASKLAGMVAVMELAVLPAVTVSPVVPLPLKVQFTIGVCAVGKLLPVSTKVTAPA